MPPPRGGLVEGDTARLQEERWRLASGMPLTTRGLMLADYAEQWLEVMRCRLRPTTFAGYELCLGRAVRMLGSVPIARLTPQLIQSCYAGLLIWKDLSSAVTDLLHRGGAGGDPPRTSIERLSGVVSARRGRGQGLATVITLIFAGQQSRCRMTVSRHRRAASD